jgi:DNA-directed RNA polymerase subunit M/transcription elongation factor TFIIS
MQKAEQLFATIALAAAAAIFCSGCPALMVPSLAYQGYKYEHNKNEPAASASSTSSTQSKKSTTPSQQQKIPDSEIE